MTEDGLKEMDPKCMRTVTDADFVSIVIEKMMHGVNAGEAWVQTYQEVLYVCPFILILASRRLGYTACYYYRYWLGLT